MLDLLCTTVSSSNGQDKLLPCILHICSSSKGTLAIIPSNTLCTASSSIICNDHKCQLWISFSTRYLYKEAINHGPTDREDVRNEAWDLRYLLVRHQRCYTPPPPPNTHTHTHFLSFFTRHSLDQVCEKNISHLHLQHITLTPSSHTHPLNLPITMGIRCLMSL